MVTCPRTTQEVPLGCGGGRVPVPWLESEKNSREVAADVNLVKSILGGTVGARDEMKDARDCECHSEILPL